MTSASGFRQCPSTSRTSFESLNHGKLPERNETFCLSDQKPKTVARDISDFHSQSGCSKLPGFHSRAPESIAELSSHRVASNHEIEASLPHPYIYTPGN